MSTKTPTSRHREIMSSLSLRVSVWPSLLVQVNTIKFFITGGPETKYLSCNNSIKHLIAFPLVLLLDLRSVDIVPLIFELDPLKDSSSIVSIYNYNITTFTTLRMQDFLLYHMRTL